MTSRKLNFRKNEKAAMFVYQTDLVGYSRSEYDRALDMRWKIANEARSAELAIIISCPTSAGGIIVLLKTFQNRGKLDWNGNQNAPKIHAYAYHICRVWYNGSYTMATKPIKFLELHYTMTQFLIIDDITSNLPFVHYTDYVGLIWLSYIWVCRLACYK